MPASEETYRGTPTLHLWFGISSVLFLLVMVWMIVADHTRPWKKVQREFHQVELAKLAAAKEEKNRELLQKHQSDLTRIREEIRQAEAVAEQNAPKIREQERRVNRLEGEFESIDTERKFKKAEVDSLRSLYDGMIERGQINPAELEAARVFLSEKIRPTELALQALTARTEAKELEVKQARQELEALRGNLAEKQKQRENLEREVTRIERLLTQKEAQYGAGGFWNRLGAAIRGLPILDLAAPPTKIQQITLPELTINYNFKDVPRFDRCTTCHQGIDRIGYDTTADGGPMPLVFRSHPRLTEGATYIDPRGREQQAGLYLDANGPHPINSFGCTICHGGQGSGTDFSYASHTPNDLHQEHDWQTRHHWHSIHFWDEPMLPRRFLESSCLKCHHQVTDIKESDAPKLRAGYERITRYGCTGCHTIGGQGSFGPDLTDNRQVGPNLAHLASKASEEWTARWIRNPHLFKPDTRMPRFYDVDNVETAGDAPKVAAEVRAMTHYLYAVSTPPPGFVDPPAAADPERGKALFFQKGCMACHSHRPYSAEDFPARWRDQVAPGVDPAQTFAPETLPEPARRYAAADYGPNLVNVAAKFASQEQGQRWLTNWIHQPEAYHPKSLMPTLQLDLQDSADIAAWLLSVPAAWQVPVAVPPKDDHELNAALDELVRLYLTKSKSYYDPSELLRGPDALADLYLGKIPSPKVRTVLLSEVDAVVAGMSRDEKLMYLGKATISRLGCFGCHEIPGFADAKPIGTPLNGWGIKSPSKLDYAHIVEYLVDRRQVNDQGEPDYDGTDAFYFEQIQHQTRMGFLYQKLHRPRSYDYKKVREELKTWDDRLRMPQFAWADDPKAIEEVMTFVLGLTGEKINSKYLPDPTPAQAALAQGERLLNRYNCRGCHTFAMPRYTIAAGTRLLDALPDFEINIDGSHGQRRNDFAELGALPFDPKIRAFRLPETIRPDESIDRTTTMVLPPDDGKTAIEIEGMPVAVLEEEDERGQMRPRVSVQLWRPVTIRGYTFQPYDNLTVALDRVAVTPAEGGDFAWLYAYTESERSGANFAALWNRLPPPLLREGEKVQTPWVTSFLKDPYAIRPFANLRMPRFHYGSQPEPDGAPVTGVPPTPLKLTRTTRKDIEAETRDLANYFAARDRVDFPYQDLPERDRAYLSARERQHPNYLQGGWRITSGLCLSCHALGALEPNGGPNDVRGPDLNQVADRFRPDYLTRWLAFPGRMIPYTAMPQNILPHPPAGAADLTFIPDSFKGKPFDQVEAVRDMLLNYIRAVEGELATVRKAPPQPPRPAGEGEE